VRHPSSAETIAPDAIRAFKVVLNMAFSLSAHAMCARYRVRRAEQRKRSKARVKLGWGYEALPSPTAFGSARMNYIIGLTDDDIVSMLLAKAGLDDKRWKRFCTKSIGRLLQ